MALDPEKAKNITEACELIRTTTEVDILATRPDSHERNLYAAVATLAGMLGELAEDVARG